MLLLRLALLIVVGNGEGMASCRVCQFTADKEVCPHARSLSGGGLTRGRIGEGVGGLAILVVEDGFGVVGDGQEVFHVDARRGHFGLSFVVVF